MKTPRLGALVLLGGLALIHCSGGTTAGGPTCAPAQDRAAAVTCAPTNYPVPGDAGPPSCATDADCTASGSGLMTCRVGKCVYDECLTDGDCANGGVCACSTDYYGGNAQYHPNVCVPADCHVDADCGTNGVCAPSLGYCGSLEGFHCGSSTAGSCGATDQTCNFSSEVGRFACSAAAVCNG